MIDLTPLDVRNKKGDFARALRGYDPAVVDHFLDLVAERMEELVRENGALRERSSQQAESLNSFRERERAMNEALVSAQQLREEVRSQASREADLALREARAEGERLVQDARREATEVVESTRRLQAQRVRYLRTFRALLERQSSELELEEERLREGGGGEAEPPSPPAPAEEW